jgi:uncharacterized membrane protein required for colicin V production
MNAFDIVLIVLPSAFFLLGYVRGAWRELLSLGGAATGAVLGARYLHVFANAVGSIITDRDFASVLSFVVIFLLCYLAGGFLGGIVEQQTRSTAPSQWERLLAAIFGASKGLVMSLSVVWLVGKFLPAFQMAMRHSYLAQFMDGLLKLLARNSPL